jgi:hypothetical protein
VEINHAFYTSQLTDDVVGDEQDASLGWTFLSLLLSVFVTVFGAICHAPVKLTSVLGVRRGSYHLIVILLVALLSYQAGVQAKQVDEAKTQVFLAASPSGVDTGWYLDTGCNRFVTNDRNDLLPASIKYTKTNLSTANGTATAECEGTVLVRSETTNKIIAFENVLYLPTCSKKLMPVRPFLQKGCSIRLDREEYNMTKSLFSQRGVKFSCTATNTTLSTL